MAVSSRRSAAGSSASSARSRVRSAFSVSACEWTETYSPAAIDMAPATSPATPLTSTVPWLEPAAATPMTRLAVETMPSLAPSTAARSQPIRAVRWRSRWRSAILGSLFDERTGGPSHQADSGWAGFANPYGEGTCPVHASVAHVSGYGGTNLVLT